MRFCSRISIFILLAFCSLQLNAAISCDFLISYASALIGKKSGFISRFGRTGPNETQTARLMEQVILDKLRDQAISEEGKVSKETLELLRPAFLHLEGKASEDFRIELSKLIIEQLDRNPEIGHELLELLKLWRYVPTNSEAFRILNFVHLQWMSAAKTIDQKVRSFGTLPSVIGELPELVLRIFSEEAIKWVQNTGSGFRHHYLPFLHALLKMNPQLANSFVQETARIGNFHIPKLSNQSLERQGSLSRQAAFINLYFTKVLRSHNAWFEKEVHKFSDFGTSSPDPTPLQFRMVEALKANGTTAMIEYQIPRTGILVDIFIPYPGSLGKVIELDGGQHVLINENFISQLRLKDIRRDELLRSMGYLVIRMSNREAAVEADRMLPRGSSPRH